MDSTLIALGVRSVYIVCRLGSWWWLEERGRETASAVPSLRAHIP